MEIILLERITNLGNLGDVIKVKNGYARNFLIPNGKAKRANALSLKEFDEKRAEYERNQASILANAHERHVQLEGNVYTINAKAGVDGKLFGSVTNMDIAEAIIQSGVQIKKSEITLPNGPLKTIGEFEVDVILHHDVHSKVKVLVQAQA